MSLADGKPRPLLALGSLKQLLSHKDVKSCSAARLRHSASPGHREHASGSFSFLHSTPCLAHEHRLCAMPFVPYTWDDARWGNGE